MQDVTTTAASTLTPTGASAVAAKTRDEVEVVSTHVLVPDPQVQQLRELSRKTRIAQSEYLREAVEDLLSKYQAESQG